MDFATEETVKIIETLGATAYGTNRMALAIDLEINRDLPSIRRLEEVQRLGAVCSNLDIQWKDAVAIATRLSQKKAPLGPTFLKMVTEFTAHAGNVQRLCLIGRDWSAPDSLVILSHLKFLGAGLNEQFSAIHHELKLLENPVRPLSKLRSIRAKSRRRPTTGRHAAIDEMGTP